MSIHYDTYARPCFPSLHFFSRYFSLQHFSLQCYHFIFICSLLIIGLVSNTYAQGIRIIDCHGHTRALKPQSQELGATFSVVRLEVLDSKGQSAQAGKFKLTNKDGKVLQTAAKDGIVQFEDVGPGVWMLGAEDPNFFFSSISLTDSPIPTFWEQTGSFLTEVGKVALITGAVVGSAVLIHEASNGSGGDNNSVNPPPSMGCPACNPDQSAPSIPPFQ